MGNEILDESFDMMLDNKSTCSGQTGPSFEDLVDIVVDDEILSPHRTEDFPMDLTLSIANLIEEAKQVKRTSSPSCTFHVKYKRNRRFFEEKSSNQFSSNENLEAEQVKRPFAASRTFRMRFIKNRRLFEEENDRQSSSDDNFHQKCADQKNYRPFNVVYSGSPTQHSQERKFLISKSFASIKQYWTDKQQFLKTKKAGVKSPENERQSSSDGYFRESACQADYQKFDAIDFKILQLSADSSNKISERKFSVSKSFAVIRRHLTDKHLSTTSNKSRDEKRTSPFVYPIISKLTISENALSLQPANCAFSFMTYVAMVENQIIAASPNIFKINDLYFFRKLLQKFHIAKDFKNSNRLSIYAFDLAKASIYCRWFLETDYTTEHAALGTVCYFHIQVHDEFLVHGACYFLKPHRKNKEIAGYFTFSDQVQVFVA